MARLWLCNSAFSTASFQTFKSRSKSFPNFSNIVFVALQPMQLYKDDSLCNPTFFKPPLFKITDFRQWVALIPLLYTEISWHAASHNYSSSLLKTFLACEGLDTEAVMNWWNLGVLSLSSLSIFSHVMRPNLHGLFLVVVKVLLVSINLTFRW